MDWSDEKYDVSAVCMLTYTLKQTVKSIQLKNDNPSLCSAAETPDCSGEDGAEGAVPLHPSSHVLGSL